MKIFVFGSNGMLGRYFVKYLKNNNFHNLSVVALTRNELDLSNVNEKDIKDTLVKYKVSSGDVVLNAAGVINVMVNEVGEKITKHINSIFPNMLSKVCEELNLKMIHITTDCVFSGEVGNYDENAKHDCYDVYGKTKSQGEPKNCCVIRTSIVGEEVNNKRSLIEWVKSKKGKVVDGFTNHTWNGLTCLELCKVVEKIINNNWYWSGVRHIHSPDVVTKKELLSIINYVYNLDIDILDTKTEKNCYRSLKTIYDLQRYEIPKISEQVMDLHHFETTIDEFPTTVDLRTEFGNELVLGVTYAYWLHKQGKLEKVITSKGMKPFYYFCDDVEERYMSRTVNSEASGVMNLPNPWIHGDSRMGTTHTRPGQLNYEKWVVPNYKKHYLEKKPILKKQTIFVSHKYNIEHGFEPLGFFNIKCLYDMFEYLTGAGYDVIYKRPKNTEGFTLDENEMNTLNNNLTLTADVEGVGVIDDYQLVKHFDGVHLIEDLITEMGHDVTSPEEYNIGQLKLLSNVYASITSGGGNSILSSHFGKIHIMYNVASTEHKDGYFGTDSYMNKLSDVKLFLVKDPAIDIQNRGYNDYTELIKTIKTEL